MQKTKIAVERPRAEAQKPTQAIALAELENAMTLRGHALWNERRGNRLMPSRADMSPRIMASLLRNTVLVRVVGEGVEFIMRIVGDAIVQAQGISLQGKTMAEVDMVLPGYGTLLGATYRMTYETREPSAWRGWFVREADGRAMYHESLLLPLGDDPEIVDHIMIVGAYAMEPGAPLR